MNERCSSPCKCRGYHVEITISSHEKKESSTLQESIVSLWIFNMMPVCVQFAIPISFV